MREITAAFHRPPDHTRVSRKQFDNAGTYNSASIFQGIIIKGCIKQRRGQSATFGATYHHGAQVAIRAIEASMAQDFSQRRTKRHFNHLWLAIRHIVVYRQYLRPTTCGRYYAGESFGTAAHDYRHVTKYLDNSYGCWLIQHLKVRRIM